MEAEGVGDVEWARMAVASELLASSAFGLDLGLDLGVGPGLCCWARLGCAGWDGRGGWASEGVFFILYPVVLVSPAPPPRLASIDRPRGQSRVGRRAWTSGPLEW